MKAKSFDQLYNYLMMLDEQYTGLYNWLRKYDEELFNREIREQRKINRHLISLALDNYKESLEFLVKATTFKKDVFIKFLVDYYTMIKGRNYVVIEKTLDITKGEYAIQTDLIVSDRDADYLCSHFDFDRGIFLSTVLGKCEDVGVGVPSGYPKTESLVDMYATSNSFQRFPDTLEVIRALVDLKIKNPDMSDEMRILRALYAVSKKMLEDDMGTLGKK